MNVESFTLGRTGPPCALTPIPDKLEAASEIADMKHKMMSSFEKYDLTIDTTLVVNTGPVSATYSKFKHDPTDEARAAWLKYLTPKTLSFIQRREKKEYQVVLWNDRGEQINIVYDVHRDAWFVEVMANGRLLFTQEKLKNA